MNPENSKTQSVDLWESKPWWCQPWTIILTGILLVAGSWLLFHRLWLSIPLGILIVLWWTYFLILVPRMLREMSSASPPASN